MGLRPGEISAELESLTAMTGAQLPFGQSSQLFESLTLISVSDQSIAKATRAMGEEVQALEQEWMEQSHDFAWLQEQERLAECPERLYGALDAAKVHIRGDKEHPWRDLKAGAWFTTEYIAPVAQAAFPDEAQAETWIQQVRSDLWDGKLDAVIDAFAQFTDHPRAGEPARKAVTYFTNNRERMRYSEFRAKGYQIGSGTIESGCKQIVKQRLKVAGALWNLVNCIKTAKARAALLSGQWQTLTAWREHLSLPLVLPLAGGDN